MKQTCWERERGTVGMATDAPGTAPPREKVKLWEALSVACWLVSWWLTPPIRSKSSAEGETESGFEGVGDWASPKRSLTAWAGPELDKVGGLAEKAFQSPNSPFPLDDGAAEENIFNPSLSNVSFRVKCIFLVYEKVAVNVFFERTMLTSGVWEAGRGSRRGKVCKTTDEVWICTCVHTTKPEKVQ